MTYPTRQRSPLGRHSWRRERGILAAGLRGGAVTEAQAQQLLEAVRRGRCYLRTRGRLLCIDYVCEFPAEVLEASRAGPDAFVRTDLGEPREEDAG